MASRARPALLVVVSVVAVALSLPGAGAARLVAVRGGRDEGVATPTPPAEPVPFPVLDDLSRKSSKKKTNATVGEEVISAIVDGLSGESEDAKFGSEIRQEFGYLVDAVTKLGAAAINEYAAGSGGATRTAEASPTSANCDQGADDGDAQCRERQRTARAVDNVGEGRRRQVRRLLVRYLVLLKVFALGIILPGAVLLSLLQSWKAVTLSLMALLLAGVVGIRGLVSTAAKGQTAEVIHTTGPGGHYWRRVSDHQDQEPDRLAYGAHGAYGAYAPTS